MNLRNSIAATAVVLLSACATASPPVPVSVATPAAKPTSTARVTPATQTSPVTNAASAAKPAAADESTEGYVEEINLPAYSDTVVCDDEPPIGSRIPQVVCRRNVDAERQREQAEHVLVRATGAAYEGSTN